MDRMTRRRCLLAISQALAASALAGCNGDTSSVADDGTPDTEMLALLVFDLFPHESLDPGLYVEAADQIAAQNNAVIESGLQRLRDRVGDQGWVEMPERERVRIIGSMENGEFFATLRRVSVETLYRKPAVWEMLGYGGPALEHGGYVNRGFNDIGWLPAEGEG